MSVNMTPARRCRFSNYNGHLYFNHLGLIPDDFDFEYHEKRLYELSLEIQKTESEELKIDPNRAKASIFMASTVLFCFGNLEVVDDIINYSHSVIPRIRGMAWVLRELLPISQEMRIDSDLFKQWLLDNKSKLEWSEEEGRYLLIDK